MSVATNQSVDIDYSITLWYRRSGSTSTIWDVTASGASVDWNTTIALSYPDFVEPTVNSMDITVPTDWTPNGLYNSTSPSVDHGNYVDLGGTVQCTSLTNGTWTLTLSSFNYVTAFTLTDSSSGGDVSGDVDI